jgi:hypothetical protein
MDTCIMLENGMGEWTLGFVVCYTFLNTAMYLEHAAGNDAP